MGFFYYFTNIDIVAWIVMVIVALWIASRWSLNIFGTIIAFFFVLLIHVTINWWIFEKAFQ